MGAATARVGATQQKLYRCRQGLGENNKLKAVHTHCNSLISAGSYASKLYWCMLWLTSCLSSRLFILLRAVGPHGGFGRLFLLLLVDPDTSGLGNWWGCTYMNSIQNSIIDRCSQIELIAYGPFLCSGCTGARQTYSPMSQRLAKWFAHMLPQKARTGDVHAAFPWQACTNMR